MIEHGYRLWCHEYNKEVMSKWTLALSALMGLSALGCNIQDVPPAHLGWEFEEGIVSSSDGFKGSILDPGSHSLDISSSLPLVQCSEGTIREELQVLSSDQVKSGIDIYVRYAANCENQDAIKWTLKNVSPNHSLNRNKAATQEKGEGVKEKGEAAVPANAHTVTGYQLFYTYLSAPIREAVRNAGAQYTARDLNSVREKLKASVIKGVETSMDQTFGKSGEEGSRPRPVLIREIILSDIHVPKELTQLNTELASQTTKREIAINQKNTLTEQILTEAKKKELAEARARTAGVDIKVYAELIRRNPEYLTYLKVKQLPQVVGNLGKGGGTLVFGSPPNMNWFMGNQKVTPAK